MPAPRPIVLKNSFFSRQQALDQSFVLLELQFASRTGRYLHW